MAEVVGDFQGISATVREGYLRKRAADMVTCRASLDESRYPEVETLAHRMKGNGATFGFAELSSWGAELEDAAGRQDSVAAGRLLGEIEQWLSVRLPV